MFSAANNHEVLILTITGTAFCIIFIFGLKLMKSYNKFRKITIADKENKVYKLFYIYLLQQKTFT